MTFHGQIKNGVAVLDQSVTLPEGTRVRVEVEPADSEFLSVKSVEELAHEQGIQPVPNLADLTIDWPQEESIDEFLALVREVRQ
jgi:predicted DNA-binding antitoxin AbrB/MazE fold protein